MKREKSKEEILFERFVEETKAREKELMKRHKEVLKQLEAQDKELRDMQQSFNENERAVLKNLEDERARFQEKIEDLELRRDAELELLDEDIEKTGKGYIERLDRKKTLDERIEKLKAELAPQLEKLELLIKKAALKVKQGEMEFLQKKQMFKFGESRFHQNLDFFYKSKMNDLQRIYSNPGELSAIKLGISKKFNEIGELQDEIFRAEGGPDTREKRIQQARGKIITTGGLIK